MRKLPCLVFISTPSLKLVITAKVLLMLWKVNPPYPDERTKITPVWSQQAQDHPDACGFPIPVRPNQPCKLVFLTRALVSLHFCFCLLCVWGVLFVLDIPYECYCFSKSMRKIDGFYAQPVKVEPSSCLKCKRRKAYYAWNQSDEKYECLN